MSVQDRKSREFARRGQEILDAALALFESDDWEAVTVEQIAARAEVGKGTVYKHFASKDDIYARLAMGFQQRIVQGNGRVDGALPVLERLRAHLRVAWELHLSSQALHRVFLYCSRSEFRTRLSPATLAELQALELQVAQPTQALVAQGVAEGLFPPKPLPLLLFGAQAAFWGGIQLVWSGYLGDIDQGRHLDELGNFLIAGLVYNDRLPAAAPAAPSASSPSSPSSSAAGA